MCDILHFSTLALPSSKLKFSEIFLSGPHLRVGLGLERKSWRTEMAGARSLADDFLRVTMALAAS